MFEINTYALIAVIIIATIILYIAKLIVNTIKFAIEQKNQNIKLCIEKKISYKEIEKQYNKMLKEAGITSKKGRDKLLKILLKILETLPI